LKKREREKVWRNKKKKKRKEKLGKEELQRNSLLITLFCEERRLAPNSRELPVDLM